MSPAFLERNPRAAVAVLVALSLAWGTWCATRASGHFIDLQVYVMGGRAVGHGHLYGLGLPENGLPYTYPPFAAVIMAPLTLLPFPLLVALWQAAGLLALAATIGRVAQASGLRVSSWWILCLAAALMTLEPVRSTLAFGQINLLLMAAITLDVLGPRESRWRGVGVGLAAAIKLTPLIFVVYLLLTGRRRAAARAALTIAATIGVGFVIDPESAWVYWTSAMWDPDRVGGVAYAGNQSTLGVLTRWWGAEPPSLVWLAVAGSLALLALTLAVYVGRGRARESERQGSEAMAICLVAIAMLLASPISWSHHWVWCAPMALALFAWLPGRGRVLVVGGWLGVFASGCIWWNPEGEDQEIRWSPLQHLAGDAYFLAALAVVGIVLIRFRPKASTRRPGSAARSSTRSARSSARSAA